MNVVWPTTAFFRGQFAQALLSRGAGHAGQDARSDGTAGETAARPKRLSASGGERCLSPRQRLHVGDIAVAWLAFLVIAVWSAWRILFADMIHALWVLDFALPFRSGLYFNILPSCRCATFPLDRVSLLRLRPTRFR